MLAAGDIGSCGSTGDEATAALLSARPAAAVITLGDNAYDRGTSAEFSGCYEPTWGASKQRTKPSAGNHDYETTGASGYFGYFGAAAGDSAKGYYSYDSGAWHVVALNANCSNVSCDDGSEQERWLRADLANHPAACTLAYWHQPRFSSGTTHGSTTTVSALWKDLYDAKADLVLEGHEHNYERLGPLDPDGKINTERGIRSFVVGTGGFSHYPVGTPITGSEVRNGDTFGVLQLTLKANGFDWDPEGVEFPLWARSANMPATSERRRRPRFRPREARAGRLRSWPCNAAPATGPCSGPSTGARPIPPRPSWLAGKPRNR